MKRGAGHHFPFRRAVSPGVIFLVLVFLACGESRRGKLVVTFLHDMVKLDDAAAIPTQEIISGSRLSCDKKAMAVVQMGESGVFVARAVPSLEFFIPTDRTHVDLSMNEGRLGVVVKKKGAPVIINCGTTRLETRQGVFDITAGGDLCEVRVFKGSVTATSAVSAGNSPEPRKVKENEKLEIDGGGMRPSRLGSREKAMGRALEQVVIIDQDAPGFKGDASEGIAVPAKALRELAPAGEEDIAGGLRLQLLERNHGPLSVVQLKRGETIIGYASARRNMLDVVTVKGKVTVPQKDIQSVARYSAAR
ncbi:MAG: FecR domain-containing protein [Spirochaetes bacterium]|nr:FecR domain-containing protein [Spirochaetota bacterium]